MKKMKWVFFGQRISVHEDILWGAIERGWNIERSSYLVPDSEYTDSDLDSVQKDLSAYDIAITLDFSAVVAQAAHILSRPYVCWVYDCPQRALYRNEALYDENIIFHFDRTEIARLKATGIKNLHYLPLAANMYRSAGLNITDDELASMKCSISFVGNLYQNPNLTELTEAMLAQYPDTCEDYKAYFSDRLGTWCPGQEKHISDDSLFINILYNSINKDNIDQYPSASRSFWIDSLLSRELTSKERILTLNALAPRFNTNMYTRDIAAAQCIPGLIVHPEVDYNNEMYKIFFASDLNLNITLRSIESGIPQRVFDIMSVGGCVLTNWQPEMDELFIPGKDLLCFHSTEELIELSDYYLKHDEERIRVGIAGYKRAKEEYSYSVAAEKIEKTILPYLS